MYKIWFTIKLLTSYRVNITQTNLPSNGLHLVYINSIKTVGYIQSVKSHFSSGYYDYLYSVYLRVLVTRYSLVSGEGVTSPYQQVSLVHIDVGIQFMWGQF